MQEVRLTPTSYIVLGLLQFAGESTPYRLKQLVAGSVGYFWTLQHAQLYTEPERLAKGGYVTETREETGRRRKLYAITAEGHARARRVAHRDHERARRAARARAAEAVLRRRPGAARRRAAAGQPRRLAEYEPHPRPDGRRGAARASAGARARMRVERETIAFWEELAGDG